MFLESPMVPSPHFLGIYFNWDFEGMRALARESWVLVLLLCLRAPPPPNATPHLPVHLPASSHFNPAQRCHRDHQPVPARARQGKHYFQEHFYVSGAQGSAVPTPTPRRISVFVLVTLLSFMGPTAHFIF